MSSLTNNLPQLYEEEQALTWMLVKKITRLEDDLDGTRKDLDVTRQTLEATSQALNVAKDFEDQLDFQTDRLLNRNAALLDLQTTLDRERSQHDEELSRLRRDLDSPNLFTGDDRKAETLQGSNTSTTSGDDSVVSGDDRSFQELQDALREIQLDLDDTNVLNRELEVQIKLVRSQLRDAVVGDWDNVRPYLDEKLRKCCIDLKKELHGCRAELLKVNDELSNTNRDLVRSEAKSKELQEENSALQRELDSMRAASKVDAQKQKPRKSAAKGKAKLTPTEREMLSLKDRKSLHTS